MSVKPGDWWEESFNPITGCEPISEACDNCWALSMLHRFNSQGPGDIRIHPERMERLKRRKATRFFVGSLTDMFHEKALYQTALLLNHLASGDYERHTFVWLTKRPDNALDLMKGLQLGGQPEWAMELNNWFGITTETQARLDERRGYLGAIPAFTKFIHAEPLLGPLDLSKVLQFVQWVVVGGENGPGARDCHIDWIRSIRDQCQIAGVKFWFKGFGARCVMPFGALNNITFTCTGYAPGYERLLDGREWNELPD
jgi:protein gp37